MQRLNVFGLVLAAFALLFAFASPVLAQVSGTVIDGNTMVPIPDALVSLQDPADGYYAGLPGKLYAKINHDMNGMGPTFFTDATGILSDNRIPALATDTTRYTFRIPNGTGAIQVRARLIYRRAFRAFVDAKQWTEDGHGNPLEDVAPPHFGHLMEEATCRTGLRPLPPRSTFSTKKL